jgi:UDP-2-acetamido-3-amino-2,3-dideoxy-glucuronate N-acetyltransferase
VRRRYLQHPQALVEADAIGEGTRIWAFAHVMKGARVGRNCNIGEHTFIEAGACVGDNVTVKNAVSIWEGVEIRDNAFIGPGAAFTNDLNPRSRRLAAVAHRYADKRSWLRTTVVDEGASIGCHATILCGITIGRFAMVGAGAVVPRDVPPHALVLGVPARISGFVCECGQRLTFEADRARCAWCGERYQLKTRTVVRAGQEAHSA